MAERALLVYVVILNSVAAVGVAAGVTYLIWECLSNG